MLYNLLLSLSQQYLHHCTISCFHDISNIYFIVQPSVLTISATFMFMYNLLFSLSKLIYSVIKKNCFDYHNNIYIYVQPPLFTITADLQWCTTSCFHYLSNINIYVQPPVCRAICSSYDAFIPYAELFVVCMMLLSWMQSCL